MPSWICFHIGPFAAAAASAPPLPRAATFLAASPISNAISKRSSRVADGLGGAFVTGQFEGTGDFGTVTQNIRQGRLGHNPFVPIILVVVEDEEPAAIKVALNQGVDDVVPKPVSAASLMKRRIRSSEMERQTVGLSLTMVLIVKKT